MLKSFIRLLSSKFKPQTTKDGSVTTQSIQNETPILEVQSRYKTDKNEIEKLLQPASLLQQEIKKHLQNHSDLEPNEAIFILAFEQITQDIRFESEEIKQRVLSICLNTLHQGLQTREKAIREILTYFEWDFYDYWMNYYKVNQVPRPHLFPAKRGIDSQPVKNKLLISAITTRFYSLRNIYKAESKIFVSGGGRLAVDYYEYELLDDPQTETEEQFLKKYPPIENNQILRLPPFMLGSTIIIRAKMHRRYEKLVD